MRYECSPTVRTGTANNFFCWSLVSAFFYYTLQWRVLTTEMMEKPIWSEQIRHGQPVLRLAYRLSFGRRNHHNHRAYSFQRLSPELHGVRCWWCLGESENELLKSLEGRAAVQDPSSNGARPRLQVSDLALGFSKQHTFEKLSKRRFGSESGTTTVGDKATLVQAPAAYV